MDARVCRLRAASYLLNPVSISFIDISSSNYKFTVGKERGGGGRRVGLTCSRCAQNTNQRHPDCTEPLAWCSSLDANAPIYREGSISEDELGARDKNNTDKAAHY